MALPYTRAVRSVSTGAALHAGPRPKVASEACSGRKLKKPGSANREKTCEFRPLQDEHGSCVHGFRGDMAAANCIGSIALREPRNCWTTTLLWLNSRSPRQSKIPSIDGVDPSTTTMHQEFTRPFAMLFRLAWNCSYMLRTLTSTVLLLSFFASLSNLQGSDCDRSFDLRAARIRWANERMSKARADNAGQICRAYGNQFYEAVTARQSVSGCETGGERQKEIATLDAEIEAFNALIAAHCGT
jgi:hypothetical protein